MTTRRMLLAGVGGLAAAGFSGLRYAGAVSPAVTSAMTSPGGTVDWSTRLTPTQFNVLRKAGTEMPFSSPLDLNFAAGRYDCAGCGQKLFSSRTKFDSGTGWPSFYEPLKGAVVQSNDSTFGMQRTEVHCVQCQGHLGHLFNDGPRPTGLRYCMNGVAMNFVAGQAA